MKDAGFSVDRELMRRDLYLGTFTRVSPSQLDELAVEYHQRCETYDRLVCSGPIIDGAIMPATPRERQLIIRNSGAVRRELIERAAMLGYSSTQLMKAIQKHA